MSINFTSIYNGSVDILIINVKEKEMERERDELISLHSFHFPLNKHSLLCVLFFVIQKRVSHSVVCELKEMTLICIKNKLISIGRS